MNAPTPPPDVSVADAADWCDDFEAAVSAIRALDPGYGRCLRQTESATGWRPPRDICVKALQRALAPVLFLRTGVRRRFFAAATQRHPRLRLLSVMAAFDHLERGDVAEARAYSRRALHLNQDDLLAQDLYIRCHPDAPRAGNLSDRFCEHPFMRLETQSRDRIMFCCPTWLPAPMGTLGDARPEDVWNSPAAQDIRRSVLDGSFRYCSRMHCALITSGRLPKRDDPAIQDRYGSVIRHRQTELPFGPRIVHLSHDRSCNLSCPSCRTELITAKAAEVDAYDRFAARVLKPLVAGASKVSLTGSGDPFASRHFRRVFRMLSGPDMAHLRFDLLTNGLLLKASWDELGLSGRVANVGVSIDAATARTYEIVRRGGTFDKLVENLDYLAGLRQAGLCGAVRLDFVVQRENFAEMAEAADMMRRYGFDAIKFQMIRSWGTWSPDEFATQDIGDPDHPEFEEFRRVLRDPRLQGPDVQWSGFSAALLPGHRTEAAAD